LHAAVIFPPEIVRFSSVEMDVHVPELTDVCLVPFPDPYADAYSFA
jgi:hypothetical protein